MLARERRKRFAEHAGIQISDPVYAHTQARFEQATDFVPMESAETTTQDGLRFDYK